MQIEKFKEFYFGRLKKFSKLSAQEIFQHFQFEYLEEFILMSKEEFKEIQDQLTKEIESWKMEYSMRGISYYSPINKLRRNFKFAKIDIFAYQDENSIWRVLMKNFDTDKSHLYEFPTKVEVLKLVNQYSKLDWRIKKAL